MGGLLLRDYVVNEDYLFGLVEVGDVSVLVYAATEVSCPRPVSRTAADEIKEDVCILDDLSPNLESYRSPGERHSWSQKKFNTDFRRSLARCIPITIVTW